MKQIFDEIANENSTNQKMVILRKYDDNDLLKRVLYLANSKRVNFYIKQIPDYWTNGRDYGLEWALVELEKLSSRSVTGGDAVTHLKDILSLLNDDDAYIIERIIDRNCKIGMGTSNINKVFPKLIEKTPYMGAKPFNEKLARDIFNSGYGYSQIKMDGRYANAIIRDGDVELISRQGELTHVGDALFLKELSNFYDGVLNGELTVDGLDRYTANGVVASIVDIEGKRDDRGVDGTNKKIQNFTKKHGSYLDYMNKIRFTVWDIISIEDYFEKKSSIPYNKRLFSIAAQITGRESTMVSIVENRVVHTYSEAMLHFQEALKNGEEGTILKSNGGVWKDGKGSHQIKFKVEIDLDLVIKGFNYGTKGTKNENVISSLNVESSDGLLKTSPGGIKECDMEYITKNQNKLLNTIVEVKCSGLSQNNNGKYSLLHPVFKYLRDDKIEGNSLEECIQINNSALGLS